MHLILASLLTLITLTGPLQQTDWRAFSSAEGRFSAVVPAEPLTSTIATQTDEGVLLTHTVSATDRYLNEYLVSWTAYNHNVESKGTEKTFDRVRDALISTKGGKLVGESAPAMQGKPGRAIVFTDSDGRTVKARFFFVGNHFYQLMAEERDKTNGADSDRFLDSFKVND